MIIDIIGDGSCFFHCLCKALIDKYNDEKEIIKYAKDKNVRNSRSYYTDNLRKSICQTLLEVNENLSIKQIIFNYKINNIHQLFNKYVLSDKKRYNYFDVKLKNYKWEIYIYKKYFFGSKRQKIIDYIIDNCILYDNKTDEYSEAKEEDVINIFNNVKDISENYEKKKIEYNLDYLNDGKISDKKLFLLLRKDIIFIKETFRNKNDFSYLKYNEFFLDNIKDIDSAKQIIMKSIFSDTKEIFTKDNFDYIMKTDPREDFEISKDDFLWKLPLNINYFIISNYSILKFINISINFHILKLLKNIDSREFVAIDGIITLIPYMFNVNIYFLTINNNKIKVYDILKLENNTINVVIKGDNVHFELIGVKREGKIQKYFKNDDTFILYLEKLK